MCHSCTQPTCVIVALLLHIILFALWLRASIFSLRRLQEDPDADGETGALLVRVRPHWAALRDTLAGRPRRQLEPEAVAAAAARARAAEAKAAAAAAAANGAAEGGVEGEETPGGGGGRRKAGRKRGKPDPEPEAEAGEPQQRGSGDGGQTAAGGGEGGSEGGSEEPQERAFDFVPWISVKRSMDWALAVWQILDPGFEVIPRDRILTRLRGARAAEGGGAGTGRRGLPRLGPLSPAQQQQQQQQALSQQQQKRKQEADGDAEMAEAGGEARQGEGEAEGEGEGEAGYGVCGTPPAALTVILSEHKPYWEFSLRPCVMQVGWGRPRKCA